MLPVWEPIEYLSRGSQVSLYKMATCATKLIMREKKPNNYEQGDNSDEENGPKPLFELGQIVGTPGALQELQEAEQNPIELIFRHVTGDWGDLCEEDIEENEFSLERGLRILSAYELATGKKIWVITEHDRSVTTILRPIDY